MVSHRSWYCHTRWTARAGQVSAGRWGRGTAKEKKGRRTDKRRGMHVYLFFCYFVLFVIKVYLLVLGYSSLHLSTVSHAFQGEDDRPSFVTLALQAARRVTGRDHQRRVGTISIIRDKQMTAFLDHFSCGNLFSFLFFLNCSRYRAYSCYASTTPAPPPSRPAYPTQRPSPVILARERRLANKMTTSPPSPRNRCRCQTRPACLHIQDRRCLRLLPCVQKT